MQRQLGTAECHSPAVDNSGLHHAGPSLSNFHHKVEKVRTVVRHSVIRPRHVLHLFNDPLFLAQRLHSHRIQHALFTTRPSSSQT